MDLSSASVDTLTKAANTVRVLSAEAVEQANSGHPGMPMGMAEIGVSLFLGHLVFNPEEPQWINRDRLVVSNGHGSMLLYSLLHLAGYDLSIEDIKAFRQWGSKTPGHPESHMTAGVEATTGPLGQGISNVVGMAIASRAMGANCNTSTHEIVSNRIFCLTGDGCLMEGVSSEACSLAGHLGLGNITAIYDDNQISIAGHTDLAFTENVGARYEAYGWHVLHVDGHDVAAIDQAIQESVSVTDKPSLICARTIIGKGSPNKANSHDVHGAALGADELQKTKEALGWTEEPFTVPAAVRDLFASRVEENKAVYQSWNKTFAEWREANPERAKKLDAQLELAIPDSLFADMKAALPSDGKAVATRKLSGTVIQVASKEVPALLGGSADLEPSTYTLIKGEEDFQRETPAGRNLRFGVREHAMGAIMNGMAYYGGYIPYGSTFLCFSDYMRPSIRLAALSHLPGLFIFTHDSIFLGEDGPTHQAVEHVASLRMIPNLWVFRPADGIETAVAYDAALRRKDGPSALVFSRQGVPELARESTFDMGDVYRGAYLLRKASGTPRMVVVATGSEVSLAVDAVDTLGETSISIVSMPCWELFEKQDEAYKNSLFPADTPVVSLEAGSTFGWASMIGRPVHAIGVDHFGASAPAGVLAEKYGFTPQTIAARLREHLA